MTTTNIILANVVAMLTVALLITVVLRRDDLPLERFKGGDWALLVFLSAFWPVGIAFLLACLPWFCRKKETTP